MKRLGDRITTQGRERQFAVALFLMYTYLFLLHINSRLWFKLLIVYYPCIVLLLLPALLPRYRTEKIELKLILLFAAWMIFTRILNWDVSAYIERWRQEGPAYPDDAMNIANSVVIYVPMAACLILQGKTREKFLDAIAIITAAFSTLTTTFSLYAVLNKISIPAPFGGTCLCIIEDPRLYVFGKNPNTCCMWYFLGIFFLAYLFFRTKNRLCRTLIVIAGFLNYVILAMTFSRNGMFSFSLCLGLLVLVLVLRRFSPKTVGKKLLCTVLVLALIVPLAYKSFNLVYSGMEKASSVVIQNRKAAQAAQTAAISAEELKLLANIIYCEAGSESYVGKVAVGNVIMNRVKSASQPNTITEVVYAKGQFSPVRNGSLQRALSSDKADAACYQAAIEALAGAQPVGGKLFFRRNNGRSGQVIGHHVFY